MQYSHFKCIAPIYIFICSVNCANVSAITKKQIRHTVNDAVKV
jgi:hypothetical protein